MIGQGTIISDSLAYFDSNLINSIKENAGPRESTRSVGGLKQVTCWNLENRNLVWVQVWIC